MLWSPICLAVPGSCCTGQGAAVECCVTLASLPAQPSFRGEAGGRGGCGSPGPHLTWSQHVGEGRCLNVHSALLVCMYIMTYPENPGEKFPSDTWLRALTHGPWTKLSHGVRMVMLIMLMAVGVCSLQQGLGFRGYHAGSLLFLSWLSGQGTAPGVMISSTKAMLGRDRCQTPKHLLLFTVYFGQDLFPSALMQLLFVYIILRKDFPSSSLLILILCSS